MELYFAPLEGITTYMYRNTHAEIFGGADAYFAPFINPSEQEKISKKGIKDILPEHNQAGKPKVQVLTNNAEAFLKFRKKIEAFGYEEININLGCPAARVVQKGRGAGFLANLDGLERFFEDIFSKCSMPISVKTRIGYAHKEEMERLVEIYNQYPLSLLIVHPRTRADFYEGTPDMEAFSKVYHASKSDVCYNGDIWSVLDYQKIKETFPDLKSIMLGRGAIKNPALFREIKGGKALTTEELVVFSRKLMGNYYEVLRSETFTLYKLKEIWVYCMQNYPKEKKIAKAIKKAKTFSDFSSAIGYLPEL